MIRKLILLLCLAALLKPVKPDIEVEIVPGVAHIGAMNAPAMLDAVAR
jgi:hypothetical protein